MCRSGWIRFNHRFMVESLNFYLYWKVSFEDLLVIWLFYVNLLSNLVHIHLILQI